MKPSQISLLCTLCLLFLFGCLDQSKLAQLQEDEDKDAATGKEKPIPRPEFEKPVRALISETWKAHQEEAPAEISLWQLFAFLEPRLTPEGKQALLNRGHICLKKGSAEGGSFSNRGKPILHMTVQLDTEELEMDVPAVLSGTYLSFEKECRFTFDDACSVKVCRNAWYLRLCTKIQKVEATQMSLYLQLKDTDDLYYSFEQRTK
ncbi:MAG: hypothetical protein HY559_01125 [Gammaproteobacteria bacterium]|nr:hypothetical protein [Gammaproteobacteria bacterium]